MDGCPWRIDFSRADASLIASRGSDVSMSFFLGSVVMAVLSVIVVKNAYKLHAGGVPTAEAHLVTSSHAIFHYKIG